MLVYLALLSILCLSLFLRVENFEEKKKGILVLYGESFRSGNMGSRTRDCEECIETQKLASQSHQDFIQYVKRIHNLTLDVLIDTYDTPYEEQLKGHYHQPAFYSHPELLGWDNISQHAVNQIDKSKYDFILMTRLDIFIKPEFYPLFQPSWKKIMFLSPVEQDSLEFPCGFKESQNIYYPLINPIFLFFPKSYFYTLDKINMGHEAWQHYMDTYHLTEKDMSFMVEYQYNANSANVQNSYYKMVSRLESETLMDFSKKMSLPYVKKTKPTC
jgi:hypothetical protein